MKRGKFSLSNYKLLSCDAGELVPCGMWEVLPGDTVQAATSALLRASPLLAPVMHPVDVRIHHWFVPHRLVWEDWENFITGGPDGLDASVFPTITIGGGSGAAIGSLADYLGVPTGVNNIEVSALPFRGYAMIWNEWYRDQDLQTKLTIDKTSGADTTTNTTLQNICWEKDYFTSARPWEQKGAGITIPLGDEAPVLGIAPVGDTYSETNVNVFESTGAAVFAAGQNQSAGWRMEKNPTQIGGNNVPWIRADLTDASAITVTALREAMALQRYEEARARFGSRYVRRLIWLRHGTAS